MGFFRRLFRSDTPGSPPERPSPPDDTPSTPFVTNAPADWPAIAGDASALTDDDFVPRITFVAAVADAVGKGQIEQMEATLLLDGGLLRVPVIVARGGRLFGLFPYPAPTPEAAAHFAGIQAATAEESWTPLYVSTGPLPDDVPAQPVLTAGVLALEPFDGELPEDDYAMWWPPPRPDADAPFDLSGLEHWSRTYEAFDGINTHVFAALAKKIGLLDPDEPVSRAHLPEDLLVQPARGPEGLVLLVSASQEKGIRLHFPRSTTSDVYLRRYLDLLAGYAEGWKSGALEMGFALETPAEGDEHPLGWWRLLRSLMDRMQAQGELDDQAKVGTIPIRGARTDGDG